MSHHYRTLSATLFFVLLLGACRPAPAPTPSHAPPSASPPAPHAPTNPPTPEQAVTAVHRPPSTVFPSQSPLDLAAITDQVSAESLLGFLEHLTSIQPYSGWRSGGSVGEVEAQQYVEDILNGYAHLGELSMQIERQSFPVFLTVEFWEARLHVTVAGKEIEVPASALRGSRYNSSRAPGGSHLLRTRRAGAGHPLLQQ